MPCDLILALDVPTRETAAPLLRQLRGSVRWVKIGLQMFTAYGPDYVRAVAESIRGYVPARYATLGTDGFGRSDTRANLRDYFEVDARWIAFTAMCELQACLGCTAGSQQFAQVLGLDIA